MYRKEVLVSTRVLIKNSSGFALVEVLLTVGISLIITVGMVSLAIFSVKSSVNSRLNSEAVKTAQKEIEQIKLLRDTSSDWTSFLALVSSCRDSVESTTDGCHIELTDLGSLSPTNGANQKVTGTSYPINYSFGVSDVDGGSVEEDDLYAYVAVNVWWTVGQKINTYSVHTILSDWRDK